MVTPSNVELVFSIEAYGGKLIDTIKVNTRLPMLVYVSCEKRLDYDHKKKVGAMNALVHIGKIWSNGPFILNLNPDHHYTQIRICGGLTSILGSNYKHMYYDCCWCFTSMLYTKELTNNKLYIRKKLVISNTNRSNSVDLCVQFKDFFFFGSET